MPIDRRPSGVARCRSKLPGTGWKSSACRRARSSNSTCDARRTTWPSACRRAASVTTGVTSPRVPNAKTVSRIGAHHSTSVAARHRPAWASTAARRREWRLDPDMHMPHTSAVPEGAAVTAKAEDPCREHFGLNTRSADLYKWFHDGTLDSFLNPPPSARLWRSPRYIFLAKFAYWLKRRGEM